MRAWAWIVAAPLAAVAVLGLLPATSVADSLADARQERARLQQRLEDATRRLGRVEARVADLEAERDAVAADVGARREALAAIDERITERVRAVYKHGATVDPLAVFLASEDPADALDRAGTVRRLVHGDRAEVEEVAAARAALRARARRLEERQAELEAALEEQRQLTAEVERDLERAREVEQRLEREARERRARQTAQSADPAPAPSSGGRVCPVDQPRSFSDTWGAARSGGRRHRGTDVLAPRGTPVRAITSGVWDVRSPGANAGNWAILRGDDGNQYWYLHLQRHTVGDGARVSAGRQTATNGDTGNARGTPHLHFELHPGGGAAVNPYSLLRRVC